MTVVKVSNLRIMESSCERKPTVSRTRSQKVWDRRMAWAEQVKELEGIAGERRGDRRYEIQLETRWKLIRRRRVLDSGVGRTVDLSSGGVLFDCGRALPAGLNAELAIAWPVLLHNVAPLQLIVSGRIVRSAGNRNAIRIAQHEFRTMATANGANRAPSALLTNNASSGAVGKFR